MNKSFIIFSPPLHKVIPLAAIIALITGGAVFSQSSKSSKPATATEVKLGKAFIKTRNCSACHTIDSAGGCLAPPLDGIAKRRNKDFIVARISNSPKAVSRFALLYGQAELMPHPRVNERESRSIATYLLTLPSPHTRYTVKGHERKPMTDADTVKTIAGAKSLKEGKKLLSDAGCMLCHSVGGLGGTFAPSFDYIGDRLTTQSIRTKVSRANLLIDGTDEYDKRSVSMPPCNLTTEDVDKIAAYLATLHKGTK